MRDFFSGVKDPTNLDSLVNISNPYQYRLEETAKLSGPNDRKTDNNGNDFWVETTELMGD